MVRHPYKKDPKRDPYLDNCPLEKGGLSMKDRKPEQAREVSESASEFRYLSNVGFRALRLGFSGLGFTVGFRVQGCRAWGLGLGGEEWRVGL